MVLLTNVTYEVFESDAEWLDQNDNSSHHVIDREIRLQFADAPDVFVSWQSTPVQYAIGYQGQSFFGSDPEVVRDMTRSEMWTRLVGQRVAFNFEDPDHQILRIHAGPAFVYCLSFEGTWRADVVNVSSELPNKAMQAGDASRRR